MIKKGSKAELIFYRTVCLSDECMTSAYVSYRSENSVTVELNRMIQ